MVKRAKKPKSKSKADNNPLRGLRPRMKLRQKQKQRVSVNVKVIGGGGGPGGSSGGLTYPQIIPQYMPVSTPQGGALIAPRQEINENVRERLVAQAGRAEEMSTQTEEEEETSSPIRMRLSKTGKRLGRPPGKMKSKASSSKSPARRASGGVGGTPEIPLPDTRIPSGIRAFLNMSDTSLASSPQSSGFGR